MLDIKFLIATKDAVKENIRKKFQDDKIPLVDEAAALYTELMELKHSSEAIRADRNKLSAQVPVLMKEGKKEEAEAIRAKVKADAATMKEQEARMEEVSAQLDDIMKRIPQMIDPSVPIGKDDSENVEVARFGEPVVPDYEIPYHAEIMTALLPSFTKPLEASMICMGASSSLFFLSTTTHTGMLVLVNRLAGIPITASI